MEVPVNAIYYFLREGLWNQCRKFCQEEYKSVDDPAYIFWRAYASYRNGQPNDAINDLNSIYKKKEIQYAVIVALMVYHKACQTVDQEALARLTIAEDDAKRLSGDKSFILLTHFSLLNEDVSAAEDYLSQLSGSNDTITCAKAWVEVYQNNEVSLKNALDTFENILHETPNGKNLEALMGKARASELMKKFTITIDTLNEIIVLYPQFTPALSEKARLLMVISDWEQCIETVTKVLAQDERNILALRIYVFYLLAREGNLEEGLQRLLFLKQTIEKAEPQNAHLLYKCAQLFSRVSGRDFDVLRACYEMMDRALKINPIEADYAIEKASIILMTGDTQNAFSLFQEANSLDESKVESLTGMIQCRLLQGKIDDAAQQIEFVNEVQVSVGRTPEIAFLEAMLIARKPDADMNAKIAATVKTLDECLRLHIALTKQLNAGFEFYIKLNPDFLLNMCKEYLQWLNLDLGRRVESVPHYVVKGNRLLETVTKQIPGLLAAHLLLAKGKLGAGDTGAALRHIERVIEINPKHVEATILYALISFQTGNVKQAYACLEEAIANNFQIREHPLFMLVKGEIELKNEDKEAALVTLEAAFNLPGAKPERARGKKGKEQEKRQEVLLQILTFGDKERCKLHILLAKAYIANNKVAEAKNIMDEAIKIFSGTSEEGNVLLTNAELAVASADIKKALSILKAVEPTSSYFVDSRRIMADIYLKHMMDRRHYAKCYVDIIEASPSYENYKALGDAFMRIQEPDEAVQAYERALHLNNTDEELTRLIGEALIATHDFNQAINYYENALKNDPNRHDLRLDLGRLYTKLSRFDKAEQLLRFDIYSDEFSAGTLSALKRNVEGLLSIAKMHIKRAGKSENPIQAVKDAYVKAVSMQSGVIEKAKTDAGNPEEERRYYSDVSYELGRYFAKYEKNHQKALEIFESSWKNNQTSEKILMSMAEMHLKLGDLQGAEVRCIQVLKLNSFNQDACLLISDIMMLKGEAQKAIKQFFRVLEYKSSNYIILAKTIELLHRNGRSEEIKPLIEKVQKQTPNPNDPGLCYCKGLYQKYQRNPSEALEEFFKAKRGNQYAEEAIVQMVDLYLNPDQDLLYSTIGDSGAKQVTSQNLNAADNLIKELKSRGYGTKGQIAEAYLCMFQKGKMDLAHTKINDVLGRSSDNVSALLAQAIAKFIQGKKDDGKNALKNLSSKIYSHEHAEELERGWLMCADLLINNNNLSDAADMLKRCLRFNQACGKAEEYLGLIAEKQQNFEEAASHYEQAWKLSNGKSPSVGYRLASLYLKNKDYIQCIEVCKNVLNTYPDFQKIEKDVYSKARNSIRN